ncbi:hypothetical protein QYE76_012268 [Lolium multiflorum]|uniref:DDE Tnp4 domain-containing protein n=1 Tax=Lolium multiflorum TaxID=4521 RepID=A0AAD8TWX2_LOLMU|nr:hypothetical protein QYE76_012268 [Lolium multiflorum]
MTEDCIGAIDGTHVTAKVPRSMSAAFRGRKHYTSQNVLAAVDFDMRFTYVLAGWEGSAHDASILADSLSRPDGLQIPNGKFYLGDAGYACRPGILPPFRKTRHSSLRVTIERAFAALKNMFKVLDQKQFHTFDTQHERWCKVIFVFVVGDVVMLATGVTGMVVTDGLMVVFDDVVNDMVMLATSVTDDVMVVFGYVIGDNMVILVTDGVTVVYG